MIHTGLLGKVLCIQMQCSEKWGFSVHASITTAVTDVAGILFLLLTAELHTQVSLLGRGNRNVLFPKYFSFYMWKYWLWHSCPVKEVCYWWHESLWNGQSGPTGSQKDKEHSTSHFCPPALTFALLSTLIFCTLLLPSFLAALHEPASGDITRLSVTVKGLSLVP